MAANILFAILILFILEIYGNCGDSNFAIEKKGAEMTSINKCVDNIDRLKNISTAPSAIKVQFREADKNVNGIVRNDDLFNFLIEEKVVKSSDDYIRYMTVNGKQPLEIDLNAFKKSLGKRWCRGRSLKGKEYFAQYIVFEAPMTFQQLRVEDESELLKKYFVFDYTKGLGTLKNEYYEKYTRNPAFIALLIDLGYDVVWGDYVPNLNIYTKPFISHFKEK